MMDSAIDVDGIVKDDIIVPPWHRLLHVCSLFPATKWKSSPRVQIILIRKSVF